jgi:hypothetical protein
LYNKKVDGSAWGGCCYHLYRQLWHVVPPLGVAIVILIFGVLGVAIVIDFG